MFLNQSIISIPFHSHFQCMPRLDPNQSITCNYQASAAERMSCKIDVGRTTPTPRNPSRKAKFFGRQILNDSVPKDHVGRTRTDHKFSPNDLKCQSSPLLILKVATVHDITLLIKKQSLNFHNWMSGPVTQTANQNKS